MEILITIVLLVLVICFYPSCKRKIKYLRADYNRNYKYLLENEHKHFKTIILTDDILDVLSKAFNRKVRPNDKFIMPYYSRFSMSKKNHEDLKEMSAEYVEVALTSYSYRDGTPVITMLAYAHYGRPRWDGENMYHDYPIKEYYFVSDLWHFEEKWLMVKEQILKV